nr:MAK10-like protein [Tanacetum cinerariifolium]
MGDANPNRTLRDYSKPSHEGYRNTIELLKGNNVVPLRSDTIWLVQNRCSFHGLRSEDLNQHLKNFLKLLDSLELNGDNRGKTRLRIFQFSIRDQASNWLERLPAGSITTWEGLTTHFLAQFFPPKRTVKLHNDILMFQQHQGESLSEAWAPGGKLRDRNAKESWALLEDLALYENESLNYPRDFAKPVKAISLPEDVPSTFDCCLIELENQVQRLMEAHLALIQPTQMNKFTSSCQIYSGPTTLSTAWKIPNKPLLNISINTIRIHQCNPHDDMPKGDEPKGEVNPENTNTVEHKEEQRGTPQLELKDPTAISKTGPSRGDEEGEIEWVDVEKPLDLVDTCEESVYESLFKEMPKCSLNLFSTDITNKTACKKFLIKTKEEIFTVRRDGVGIKPDGIASPAM